MERLTKHVETGVSFDCEHCETKGRCSIPSSCMKALIDRLAVYEDAEEDGRMVVFSTREEAEAALGRTVKNGTDN